MNFRERCDKRQDILLVITEYLKNRLESFDDSYCNEEEILEEANSLLTMLEQEGMVIKE